MKEHLPFLRARLCAAIETTGGCLPVNEGCFYTLFGLFPFERGKEPDGTRTRQNVAMGGRICSVLSQERGQKRRESGKKWKMAD
ncbi:MAG: hypothetical protein J6336_13405 [Kiritimatiellae bacterium]|nr:hypothetical protein [Kiritimatiellia bacterium]